MRFFCLAGVSEAGPILYVSTWNDSEVRRYDGLTGASLNPFLASGSGGLNHAGDVVIGADGNLYVSGSLNNAILEYDGATGAFIRTFVSTGSGGLDFPSGLGFGPNGNLFVVSANATNPGNSSVLEYNGGTGAFVSTFVGSGSGGLTFATRLTFGPDGDLYVSGAHSVLRYSGGTGAFIDAFVPSGSGGLSNGAGLTFGPNGNLYVISNNNNAVLEYKGLTGIFVREFVRSGISGLGGPSDLAFGQDGDLYVTSFFTGAMLEYDGSTGEFVSAFVSPVSVCPGGYRVLRCPRTRDSRTRRTRAGGSWRATREIRKGLECGLTVGW